MTNTGNIIKLRMLARITCASVLASVLIGCVNIPERNSVPSELTSLAGIPGVPDARFWGDEWPTFGIERFRAFTDTQIRRNFAALYNRPHNYVAISGGGANGAFGAGLFAGWTASGTRPEFAMVTGISTGALTAPFVFLGSDYDEVLEQVYTTTYTRDIAEERNLISAIFSDSMADSEPLRRLIEKYITADVIAAIAREHSRGKRLFIGTVNLDAGRSVIWSIGAIAGSDYPRKQALIHDILQASAAIPVAFSPVVIPVEIHGESYDEMHVDGGAGAQAFVYPAQLNWQEISSKLKVKGKPQVYVIRNSFLGADYRGIKRSVIPIANRSIASLIRTQGIGDLYQIYALCKRDGNDFNLAHIPASFTEQPDENFDPVYMRKLYDLGYEMAKQGYPWEKGPPGFSDDPL
ncbi:MAG: lipoprotein [Nitrosomonas sp.]|nr:MAG: lipoprotein [Nitrosomonas sp.]